MTGELQGLVQYAFLRRPLAELLSACQEAAVELIVLKGAALAETVYPRPSLRPFGDIDVLVRASDACRAQAVLSELGYVADADAWADLAAGRSCEVNFFRNAAHEPVVIELHTDLLNNALLRPQVFLDHGGLWRRSRAACLAGENARVLGPEDQILHLCLHLAGHYFDAPQSVRDMVQVCAVQPVRWPLLLSLCRAAQAEAIAYGGLFAAAQEGARVPPLALESLAPRRHRRALERLVTAQVQSGGEEPGEIARFLLLWLLLAAPQARFLQARFPIARFHAAYRLLFPSRAWLRAHYAFNCCASDHYASDHYASDLAETIPARRLPLGLLYARHLRFLAAAVWKIGRKSRRRA